MSDDNTVPTPYVTRVREMPAEERPRERMLQLGPTALTSEELLAILLRTGRRGEGVLDLARRIIGERQGLKGLASTDFSALRRIKGIGIAKATLIAAAFELGRRASTEGAVLGAAVNNPLDIARLLRAEMERLEQEELHLLTLNAKHRLIEHTLLYRGMVNSSPARIAELFKAAARLNAKAIAIAHNHPSGDPTPSADDIHLTAELVKAGAIMDIEVLD